MCIVSVIGDDWNRTFPTKWPTVPSNPVFPIPEISRAEFDALKQEVESLRALLKEAKQFDDAAGQRGCEMEQKVHFLKQIAAALGVDLSDIFPERATS